MTDLHFEDVVMESRDFRETDGQGTVLTKGWRARCKTCSTIHKVDMDEFDAGILTFDSGKKVIAVDEEVFQFVAEMRAWNCCHEGEEPYDGFPDTPDSRHIK
jgi:hypothetical protein